MSPNSSNTSQQPTSQHTAQGSAARTTSKSALGSFATTPARRVVAAVLVMGLSGAITLLFWKKLQLVTGVPRTAYAEPEQQPKPEHKDKPESRTQVPENSAAQPN